MLEELVSELKTNSDNEKMNAPELDNSPLCDGAAVTVGTIMLLLALYTSKFGVSLDALKYLLAIINLCLPGGQKLCDNVHAYKKFFTSLKQPVKYHYFCSFCLQHIPDRSVHCCTNGHCLKDLTAPGAISYFLELSTVDQLKTLFKRPGFYDDLQWRFKREHDGDHISYIYDGDLYQSLFSNGGILSSPDNVSFTFNTDGVPVFKSSKVSIWPLYLVINELPFKKRMTRDCSILAGL